MLRQARQSVIDDQQVNPNKELYEWLKIEKEDFRVNDIESPWDRGVQAGQKSDEVILMYLFVL
jgi:hypothetical protein